MSNDYTEKSAVRSTDVLTFTGVICGAANKKAMTAKIIAALVLAGITAWLSWLGFKISDGFLSWVPIGVFIAALVVFLFLESHKAWKTEVETVNDLLTPKIAIIAKEDKGQPGAGGDLHWRIATRNISETVAVQDSQVKIIACEPSIPNLPLPLRTQHLELTKITLQPGEEISWDVFRDDHDGGLDFIVGTGGVQKAPMRYHWPPEKFTSEYLRDPSPPPPPIDRKDSCKIQIKVFSATGKSPDPMWFELVWIDRGLVLRPLAPSGLNLLVS